MQPGIKPVISHLYAAHATTEPQCLTYIRNTHVDVDMDIRRHSIRWVSVFLSYIMYKGCSRNYPQGGPQTLFCPAVGGCFVDNVSEGWGMER